MIHVWVVDEQGFYIEPTRKQEEDITKYDITTPLHTEFLCVKPKWDFDNKVWVEGATEEEIKEWEKTFNKPSAPNEMEVLRSQLDELSEYTLLIEMKNIELEEQTTLNSEYALDLDTRLIMLENKQI